MPVLVNPKECVDRDHCFAAGACPYGAFLHNSLKRTWEVDANICGECPGPCLNFCDRDALRWGDDLVDLSLVRAELEGKMKGPEVAEARLKHKKEAQAALEAAKKKANVGGILALTRANFEQEVLRSDIPVVVDCWADWCGPCKQFSPVFESTAKQYEGVIKFAKIDTDAEPLLARGLGITSLPSVLMFYKGQLVNAVEGALPASQFQGWLYQTLAAVRQYESQLSAEAESAITAAKENLSSLDTGEFGPDPAAEQEPGAPQNVFLDSRANQPPPPQPRPNAPGPEGPGKRTSSGLYIP